MRQPEAVVIQAQSPELQMQESSIIVPSAFIDCQRHIREKNMLTQFRNCYPQGSIVSELVTVDHGKYVVRTLVQVEGITLASGLAAADTVEQAEDRARERSLAILNLASPPQSPAPPESTAPQQSEAPVPLTLEPPTADSLPPSSAAPDVSETLPEPDEDDFSSNGQLSEPEPEEPEQAAFFEDSTVIKEPPTPPDEPEDERFSFEELELPEPITAPTPAPTPSQWSQPAPVANGPIDFSDVIAKTNVEMKRLGWTNEQGRKYLLETYGKRSRQLLSDEELLDFLRYLESLSS